MNLRFIVLFVVLALFVFAIAMQAGDKIIVHHNGEDEAGLPIIEDICISVNAVDKHIANHGDTTEFTPCQGGPEVEPF